MRFIFCVEQNVSRFNVAMQNTVLVSVVDGACHFRDQVNRAPDGHRFARDYLVELSPFDEFHAEITRTIALTDFVNRDNTWMLETGRSFRFTTETFQMRFGGPISQTDHFERHSAIETFLTRAIDYALTAATDFFLDFVIAKVSKDC